MTNDSKWERLLDALDDGATAADEPPGLRDRIYEALLAYGVKEGWKTNSEVALAHAERIASACHGVAFDDWSNTPIKDARKLLAMSDEAMLRAFHDASSRLQRVAEAAYEEEGGHTDPRAYDPIPQPALRLMLERIVNARGGSLKGRPHAREIDAVTIACVEAYEALSGARAGLSRHSEGSALRGPLVRFVAMIAHVVHLPLDTERRLRSVVGKLKASREKTF